MSKKIIITFNSEPVVGTAFDYTIQVDGLDLVYDNGLNHLTFQYQAFGGGDPDKVEIKGNLGLTIDATLAFMVENYSNSIINYARVNNTIEVSVNTDLFTVVTYSSVNVNLAITTQDISNITTVNLKYFFKYKNVVDDEYFVEIFKKDYTGASQEISGRAIIEKANVNNHLDPIRGGGVTLKLEATKDLTLEDLYSENEQDFTVKLYKNNKIQFYGYLHPDGVYQDYVKDGWVITLDCVDGLGAISNLSFVQSNGLHFTGKMLAIDIIYRCLKRTGISMPLNTSVNITYEGATLGFDVFRTIYLNADRFIKTDQNTIMSCEEVLKSVLDIFKACITQWDGEWYIYKPNEIFIQPYVSFKRYDINNNFVGSKTVNLNKNLGSQIDNFYPHHCSGNQKIEIKGSIGGFRLGYKYGLVSGLMYNPGLVKNGNALDYDGWFVNNPFYMINDPLKDHGFYFKNATTLASTAVSVISNNIPVAVDDLLSLKMDYDVKSPFGSSYIKMQIKHGAYYLQYAPANDLTPIEDTANAIWTTTPSFFIFFLPNKVGSVNIALPKILSSSNLTVAIIAFQNLGTNSTTWITSLDVIPTQSTNNVVQGEFHTVERKNRVSSMVKENQTVFNGDNPSTVYLGAIFDEALQPTQNLWSRVNSAEKFPLLRIAAEEELRISQRPTKVFRGDFYGYIPYLSFITINNVGKFMPIEWSYDTFSNITQCKQLELFVAELADIEYTYTIDYGETVKPTIK